MSDKCKACNLPMTCLEETLCVCCAGLRITELEGANGALKSVQDGFIREKNENRDTIARLKKKLQVEMIGLERENKILLGEKVELQLRVAELDKQVINLSVGRPSLSECVDPDVKVKKGGD